MHCLTGLACQGGVEVHLVSAQETATEWLLIIDIQLEWWHAAVLRRQPSRFVLKINANQPSLHCMGCCRCRICMCATAGTLDLYPIPTMNLPDHEKTLGSTWVNLNRQSLQENWTPQRADNSQLSVIGFSALEHLVEKAIWGFETEPAWQQLPTLNHTKLQKWPK